MQHFLNVGELAEALQSSLKAADEMGLTTVGIKLNDAILALGGEPPAPTGWSDEDNESKSVD